METKESASKNQDRAARQPDAPCQIVVHLNNAGCVSRDKVAMGARGGGGGYPMTAIETPGRWPVLVRIWSVTSCRSKSVRPQLGQLTYSVLVFLILEPAHTIAQFKI
jgi:hypothetical protein